MMAKDKMNKKNKTGGTFADDGFAMGKLKTWTIGTCTGRTVVPRKDFYRTSHNNISVLNTVFPYCETHLGQDHMQWNQVSPHAVEPGLPACSGTRSPRMQWNQVSPHAVEPGLPACSGTRSHRMQWNQVSPHAVEPGLPACSGTRSHRMQWNQVSPHAVEPPPPL